MNKIPTTALAIGIPAALILLGHIKSLPFAYTMRSWLLLRDLIRKAKENNLEPDRTLFSIISQDHHCYLDDIDYNQHMNNSTYNKILDFSRIHLLYTIFPRVMMEPDHHIFGHSGGVVTLFRKAEILPFSKYTVQSRIWTWNEKWLFLQHRFIFKGPENEDLVACLAISKIVFKKLSGRTVLPEEVLKLCGHDVNTVAEARRAHNWETASHVLSLDKIKSDPYPWSKL